jgi:signal transduction histidine kinase
MRMGNDFNSILLSISGVCFVIVILVIMRVFSRMPSSTSVVIPRKRLKDLEEDNAKKTEALSKSDRVVQELLSDINKLKKELQDVNLKAEEEKKKLEAEIRARDSSISNATIKMDLDSARKEITALQEQLKDRTAAVIQLEEAARSSERLKEELDAFKAKAVAEALRAMRLLKNNHRLKLKS